MGSSLDITILFFIVVPAQQGEDVKKVNLVVDWSGGRVQNLHHRDKKMERSRSLVTTGRMVTLLGVGLDTCYKHVESVMQTSKATKTVYQSKTRHTRPCSHSHIAIYATYVVVLGLRRHTCSHIPYYYNMCCPSVHQILYPTFFLYPPTLCINH